MDRLWTVLIWIILLSAVIGILRYWQGAQALASTFFGFIFGESTLLSGLQPGTAAHVGVPNYPSYNNQGA